MPIWVSGTICFLAISQQWSFVVLQSLKMDRHLGPNFQIPAASMASVGMFALIMFIPIYDRFLVPVMRRITKIDGGITLLQRQGVEMVIALIMFIPIYDRFLVPAMRHIMKIHGGITLLQRQGVEMVITTLSMFLAAMVDDERTQDLGWEIAPLQWTAISLNEKFVTTDAANRLPYGHT